MALFCELTCSPTSCSSACAASMSSVQGPPKALPSSCCSCCGGLNTWGNRQSCCSSRTAAAGDAPAGRGHGQQQCAVQVVTLGVLTASGGHESSSLAVRHCMQRRPLSRRHGAHGAYQAASSVHAMRQGTADALIELAHGCSDCRCMSSGAPSHACLPVHCHSTYCCDWRHCFMAWLQLLQTKLTIEHAF